MTAPELVNMKFWIVKPKESTNQIKNPRFDPPDFEEDWYTYGAGVTLEETGSEQRFGAYCMQVNTITAVASGASYQKLSLTDDETYTFSCYVKGTAGQTMRVEIRQITTVKAATTFTATGYWQRQEVTWTADATAADYRAYVVRNAVASTAPFYVDGAQFEQASKATTFFCGYSGHGCRWTGAPRNSSSYRPATTRYGGELIDISAYAKIISVHGFGNGQWNQVLTKMTSGGDMYQGHIRKSRNVSLVLAYHGDNQGELQANRKVIIDACRPDLLEGQEMILRYQGFDANGVEATNPVDIVCVFQPSHNDTPSMPVFQKDILNFTVPSGLFDGAYNDGKELDLYANFPAEFIVKRDSSGNWCTWDGSDYHSLITGLDTVVRCMAEAPDGKVYAGGDFTNAGTVTDADKLARWNPVTETWEAVVAIASGDIYCMAFDANGDLYIGGTIVNLGSTDGDYIVKITDINGTPTVNALGTGTNGGVYAIAIAPNGDVYAGGIFTSAGGVANTAKIAKWNGTTWEALATGLNNVVYSLAFAPNGHLYIGGAFTNADGTYGDFLCYWNRTTFVRIGTTELSAEVYVLAFGATGDLYVGGNFTNAGGNANADYVAKWTGQKWESLGAGTDGRTYCLSVSNGKVYVSGSFTTAGGLTLTDRVAIWSNGAWQPLDINLPGTGIAYSILPTSDGSLYIGGNFSTARETPDVNAYTGVVALNLNVSSASANTYPYMQVFGPGTLKAITNYSTGKTISFDGLTLQAGEAISLSFDPLNLQFVGAWAGRGNLMRYVVAGSDYGDFYLKPGSNLISLFMTGTTSASGAWMAWTPQFWGLDGALL